MAQINISGKVIKERQKRGLSIRKLAQLADLDPATVRNVEAGDWPTVATLVKLANAFNCEPGWFLK